MGQLPTKKQKILLDYISKHITTKGYSPTHEEMCAELEVNSVATIHDHLVQLAKKNLIKIYHGSVRGIEIVENTLLKPTDSAIEVPLLGYIAAGKPIEVITNSSEAVSIPLKMLSPKKKSYVLQVRGESMIEDGILDGDFVLIDEQETANNGDIVVALLENGFATLKRFFKEKNRIKLEPANAKMEPIYVRDVKIQGKVSAVIRRY